MIIFWWGDNTTTSRSSWVGLHLKKLRECNTNIGPRAVSQFDDKSRPRRSLRGEKKKKKKTAQCRINLFDYMPVHRQAWKSILRSWCVDQLVALRTRIDMFENSVAVNFTLDRKRRTRGTAGTWDTSGMSQGTTGHNSLSQLANRNSSLLAQNSIMNRARKRVCARALLLTVRRFPRSINPGFACYIDPARRFHPCGITSKSVSALC